MARLRARIVALDAEGDVQAGASVKFYQPGTSSLASATTTTGTPFAGNLYAAVSGGSPISTTQTADSSGQVVVYTDTKSRFDVGIETASSARVFTYETFEFDPSDILLDIAAGLTAGDLFYATSSSAVGRIAIGTAYQTLGVNAGATAPEWQASPRSLLTTQGDLLYASAANTPARLGIGTANQALLTNSGATAPVWGASMQSLLTTQGDIIYASAANTPARLARGTAFQALQINSGATLPTWQASATSTLTAQGDLLYASGANTLARLAKGTARQNLTMNAGATAPEWTASPASILTTTGDILYASANNTPARLGIGAARQVLRMNSGVTAPEWGATPDAWPVYNVAYYGMTPSASDGATLTANTTAWQNLWTTIATAGGGRMYFPPGIWHANKPVLNHGLGYTPGAVWMMGEHGASSVVLHGTAGPFITIGSTSNSPVARCGIKDLLIYHNDIPTGGATLYLGDYCTDFFLDSAYLLKQGTDPTGTAPFIGLLCTTGHTLRNVRIQTRNDSGSLGGLIPVCIQIAPTADTGGLHISGQTDLTGCLGVSKGIHIAGSGGAAIEHDTMIITGGVLIKDHNYGIIANFHTNEFVNIMISDTYIDGCVTANIDFEPTTSGGDIGSVGGVQIDNCWMSATGSNIIISEDNLGTVDGVFIRGCVFKNATANGIRIGNGCDNIVIQNNFGDWGGISSGTGYGINLGSGANGMIQNNLIIVDPGAGASYIVSATRDPVIVGGNLLRGKDKSFGGATDASRVNGTDAFQA